jgi:hypothetical protein
MFARRMAWGAIGACAFLIALSLYVVGQEIIVAKAEGRLDRVSRALASGGKPTLSVNDMPLNAPPRARLADALVLARAAQSNAYTADMRASLLDGALTRLQSIGQARPYWGELWATKAFAQSMRQGVEQKYTHESLDRSYCDAPYLSRAGAWRVGYGFAHWNDLNDQTRDGLLNEAVWLARSSGIMRDSVLTLARRSPAYSAYILRWMSARQGDVDFRPLQRSAPDQP